jgi:uncharacterized protein (DUF1919 family)
MQSSLQGIVKSILSIRTNVGILISIRLLPKSFTVISDDCWGSQIYRQLKIPYRTPTVGLWVEPETYLDFIVNFQEKDASRVTFINSDKKYPVAKTSYATLHFMHYSCEHEAKEAFERRFARVNYDSLFFKIDFGKPGYSKCDIDRWNKLSLKNSIAFYPEGEFDGLIIHNGLAIPDWQLDGKKMFDISRRYFSFQKWLSNGLISNGVIYRILNFLIYDPTTPLRLLNSIRGKQAKASKRASHSC